jgi:hypothetical protein
MDKSKLDDWVGHQVRVQLADDDRRGFSCTLKARKREESWSATRGSRQRDTTPISTLGPTSATSICPPNSKTLTSRPEGS